MILLGKHIKVIEADNKSLKGLEGTVIEDNRDTVRIQTSRGEKLLVKNTITIETDGFIIEAKNLVGTHASRQK